jgi:hypothetical protein
MDAGTGDDLILFLPAAIIYIALSLYLFQPHIGSFSKWQYLLIVNSPLGALGCYLLSRRWVAGFFESFFSGAVYGFGPFALGLARYHPTAGFLAAALPWLFLPAVFGPRNRWRWLAVPLLAIPFLAVILFFQLCARYSLFPVPLQLKLHSIDLVGLVAPLVAARRGMTLIGFYHIPIACLIMGISMFVVARRFGILIVLAIGIVLAVSRPFLEVGPVIWLSIPVLCCSVLTGQGTWGLVRAGFTDRKWIMANILILGALAIFTLLLATKYFQTFLSLGSGYAKLFVESGKMYILGTVTMMILYMAARAKLHNRRLPEFILYAVMALDIFIGARFIIDRVL